MTDYLDKQLQKSKRKEVDFHHKVAYRFERAYRIVKIHPEKKNQLNLDIVEVISENSDYV